MKMNREILVLSARDRGSLVLQAEALIRELRSDESALLPDICYTLQIGRDTMENRLAFSASSGKEAADILQAFCDGAPGAYYTGTGAPGAADVNPEGMDPDAAAKQWAETGNINWHRLYQGGRKGRRTVNLPGHRFDKVFTAAIPNRTGEGEELLYEEILQAAELPQAGESCRGTVIVIAPAGTDAAFRQAFPEKKGFSLISVPPCEDGKTADFDAFEPLFRQVTEKTETAEGLVLLCDAQAGAGIFEQAAGMIRGLARSGLRAKRILTACIWRDAAERCLAESLAALPKAASLILPEPVIRTVCFPADTMEHTAGLIAGELFCGDPQNALYEDGVRKHAVLAERQFALSAEPVLRSGGVYLITGGMGGIGRHISFWLLKNYRARVILLGRRAPESMTEKLQAFDGAGGEVRYMQADVCDPDSLSRALEDARKAYGTIHGYFHAAGLEGKKNILEASREEFLQVLAPKYQGTLNLLKAAEKEPYDFLFLCSSSAVMLGDFGNCAYSLGNRFQMLETRYESPRTKAINWPLWADGGMGQGDEDFTKMYLKSSGQQALTGEHAVRILEKFLNSDYRQLLVMTGERARIERFLYSRKDPESETAAGSAQTPAVSAPAAAPVPAASGLTTEERVLEELKDTTYAILQLPKEEMGEDENLADFGYDSILLTEFANALTERFGFKVTPDVFFNHPTLGRLRDHLCKTRAEELEKRYLQLSAAPAPEIGTPAEAAPKTAEKERIAIIGMSGRFPGAENPEELWRVIAEGREAVGGVPPRRRSWRTGSRKTAGGDRMGFLSEISLFDPLFFEISPSEAEGMDPQQRLIMEETWKALEHAGYGQHLLDEERVGVFTGAEDSDYKRLLTGNEVITSNNNSLLSARIAYQLNLRGPNLTVNTACSSGLTAFHQAMLSLENDECDSAVVAGVSVACTSYAFDAMDSAGMLAADRVCRAFDRKASGMVPAEAVAVLVLKKEGKAIRDRHRIYGYVAGTGINYDGRTNGITAPNGVSQKELFLSVYDQHGIRPEEIGLILAHGTGTRLGDPIELNALTDAFRERTKERGFCCITSVKSNLGHSLAASGLVSMIVLLKAMQAEQLPPQIHCEEPSEYIQWDDSPLYINRTLRSWPANSSGVRLGAVSALGMSGTNAHVVLQSAPAAECRAAHGAELLVVSAKTEEALEERCRQLADALEQLQDDELGNAAFTLMEGRMHFRFRCAVAAANRREAIATLRQTGGAVRGQLSKTGKLSKADRAKYENLQQSLRDETDPARRRDGLAILAEAYCAGFEPDGRLLDADCCRIVLPAYPFERTECWAQSRNGAETIRLENRSDLHRVRFEAELSGDAFYFQDHVILGQQVLPGVCTLELVYRAAAEAFELTENESVRLSNIGWLRPVRCAAGGKKRVAVSFEEAGGRKAAFTVYETEDGAETACCQGLAETVPQVHEPALSPEKACRQALREMDGPACYALYAGRGMSYGPAFRFVKKVYILSEGVLTELEIPETENCEGFTLIPGMADGALQGLAGFAGGTQEKARVPFAMDRADIIGPCERKMWAFARRTGGRLEKYDVDLTDGAGNLCVRFTGYTAIEAAGQADRKVLLRRETMLLPMAEAAGNAPAEAVGLCIGMPGAPEDVRRMTSDPADPAAVIPDVMEMTREMLTSGYRGPRRLLAVIPGSGTGPLLGALEGLFRAAEKENPQFSGKVIEMPETSSAEEIRRTLDAEAADRDFAHILYRDGKRYGEIFTRAQFPETDEVPWKNGGVYLLTGGNGGLGRILAKEIAGRVQNATLILTGRRAADERTGELIQAIQETGSRAEYVPLDVTDAEAVRKEIRRITEAYGRLNGIIHCAGINRDGFLIRKTREEICSVLDPKIRGIINLDEASAETALDFFISFASITGAIGNAGQTDYALANAFMDRWMIRRSELVRRGERQGVSLSIDWPLWKDGGMQVSPEEAKMLLETWGTVPMPSEEGLRMLYGIWQLNRDEAMPEAICLYGEGAAFESLLNTLTAAGTRGAEQPAAEAEGTAAVSGLLFAAPDRSLVQAVRNETRLRGQDGAGLWLLCGEESIRCGLREYAAAYDNPEEYVTALRRIVQECGKPDAVLYLSPLVNHVYLSDRTGMQNLRAAMNAAGMAETALTVAGAYEDEEGRKLAEDIGKLPGMTAVTGDMNRMQAEDLIAKMLDSCTGGPAAAEQQPKKPAAEAQPGRTAVSDDGEVLQLLKKTVSRMLKLNENRIDPDGPMDEYGLNSITILDLIRELEKTFGALPKTLFYEYDNLREMAAYLAGLAPQAGVIRTEKAEPAANLPEAPAAFRRMRREGAEPAGAENTDGIRPEDVAVIGLSGTYPQADNLAMFWENLKAGADCIEAVPWDRFDTEACQAKMGGKTAFPATGGFIRDAEMFDALFFKISPREAERTDPQERLMLMHAYWAAEDAGYTRAQLEKAGNIGVIIGAMYSEYQYFGVEEQAKGNMVSYTGTYSSLANRISYFFNLHGPSLAVDTMCSSSLTALYIACRELAAKRCGMMIVGGVNLSLHPNKYVMLSQGHFAAGSGRCMSFGEGGDGYTPAEGVGAAILKPLSQAVRDGDHIYGVIRAAEANHGGKTSGYTVPNPKAQTEVTLLALEHAGISAETVNYVEGHGTGTALGDPIEVTSLTNAFRKYTDRKGFCWLGSVKSNIGHCEAAAGMAALSKVLLQMKHRQLVPSIHSEKLNPYIPFEDTPFKVIHELREWPRVTAEENGEVRELPLRAGIESFGAGGSNVHMIVEEYRGEAPETFSGPFCMVFSARTEEQLSRLAEDMLDRIDRCEYAPEDLPSLAWTLQTGREAMACRLAFTAGTIEEMRGKLAEYLYGTPSEEKGIYTGTIREQEEERSGLFAEEEAAIVNRWIAEGRLEKVQECFVRGVAVSWELLYGDRHPNRISAPLYPFARTRCWFETPEKELSFLREEWTDAEAMPAAGIPQGKHTLWLVHSEEEAQAAEKAAGPGATAVICDTRNESGSGMRFRLDARSSDAMTEGLKNALQAGLQRPDAMIFQAPEGCPAQDVFRETGFVFKALIRNGLKPEKLVLAGRWTDAESRSSTNALYGFAQSSRSLMSGTKVCVTGGPLAQLPPERLAESCLQMLGADAPAIRLLQGENWQTSRLAEFTPVQTKQTLRRNGTYLITGGLGGIGMIVAEWLLSRYHANIVLTGRGISGSKQEKLDALQRHYGSRVRFVKADVCDAEEMRAAAAEAKKAFGALHGAFHAAGIEGTKKLTESEDREYDRILAPKVTGTKVLMEVLEKEKPELICFFSSTSALLGDFGDCAYSTGNRFMMDYAAAKAGPDCAVRVVNWPLWRNGGMGSSDRDAVNMYLRASGLRLLENREALEALEKICGQENVQAAVFARAMKENRTEAERTGGQTVKPRAPGRIAKPGTDLRKTLLELMKQDVCTLMKIDEEQVGYEVLLADYGFDSVSLTEYAEMLEEQIGVQVLPDMFFSYPTLLKLGNRLLETDGEQIARRLNEAPEPPEEPETAEQPASGPAEIPAVRPAEPQQTEIRGGTAKADEPIAIIGMSGRFPGAGNARELWEMLAEGKCAVDEMPADRTLWHEDGKSRKMGCLDRVYDFDPLFFEIPPADAEKMDPRQRLLLEECWKALETAGYGDRLLNREETGVFVGAEDSTYGMVTDYAGGITANHNAMLAARLAYFLDMKGPNMTINTACSSGLAAVHEACLSIRSGECDSAVAAAVNILFTPRSYDVMENAGMLSPTQTCRALDQDADGMVPGEGVAAVVLKRLSAALRDRHRILAVITGSGLNYDGRTNGITAPGIPSQVRLLTHVYDRFGIRPENIGYVLAHGTGTKLGDPMELKALTEAFRTYTDRKQYCAVGSIKPNIGHGLAVSGVSSLIAMVEALQTACIPPEIHFRTVSKAIDWENSPFYVTTDQRRWEAGQEGKRTGAVSSFGMGGTNVHIVLESASAEETAEDTPDKPVLLPLSARTPQALEAMAGSLADTLERGESRLCDVSYTLMEGRRHFLYRCCPAAADREEAIRLLREAAASKVSRKFLSDPDVEQQMERLEKTCADSTDAAEIMDALKELAARYCEGYALNGERLWADSDVRRIPLPTYAFDDRTYRIDPAETGAAAEEIPAGEPERERITVSIGIQNPPEGAIPLEPAGQPDAVRKKLERILALITEGDAPETELVVLIPEKDAAVYAFAEEMMAAVRAKTPGFLGKTVVV